MEPHTGLNNLDYLIIGLVVLSGFLALMRGFVREVLSLAVWIGAYFFAAHYYALAEPWMRNYIKSPSLATDASAVAIFCIAFIILSIVSFVIAKFVRGQALTAIDRSLGFLFGLLRGVLAVCLIYLVVVSIVWPDIDKPLPPPPLETQNAQGQPEVQPPVKDNHAPPEWLMKAKTRPFLAYGAELLKEFVPEKQIEATTQEYLEHKSSVQHTIDQKALDNLALPGIGSERPNTAPAKDDGKKDEINQLIEEKAKP